MLWTENLALHQTSDMSRVYPTSHSMIAGSSPPYAPDKN